MTNQYTKWVACWGNATSVTDRKECVYARDLTLRYPIRMVFSGSRVRLHLSNVTGTDTVTLTRVGFTIGATTYPVLLGGQEAITIPAGEEVMTDEVEVAVTAGDMARVDIYLGDYTQMNAGTLITGPLSSGQYAYGNHMDKAELPAELTRNTQWFYFINTIDILTEEQNHALICYGDSITAQSWPDYLTLRCEREGWRHVSIIRRAISGTRILREYDCITYAAYGQKGEKRFAREMQVAGADTVLIQHGINDIIHPVGVEVNRWRPWSDMPTLEELQQGITHLYIDYARTQGLRVYSGTLLPIYGWRTYTPERDKLRVALNEWLRTAPDFDGSIDFDAAVRDAAHPEAFAPGFDSGDHLHPSEAAYQAMAEAIPQQLLDY